MGSSLVYRVPSRPIGCFPFKGYLVADWQIKQTSEAHTVSNVQSIMKCRAFFRRGRGEVKRQQFSLTARQIKCWESVHLILRKFTWWLSSWMSVVFISYPYWWRYDNSAVRDVEIEAFVSLTHRTSSIEWNLWTNEIEVLVLNTDPLTHWWQIIVEFR